MSCICVTKGTDGDGLCQTLTLCRYDGRNGHLLVLAELECEAMP